MSRWAFAIRYYHITLLFWYIVYLWKGRWVLLRNTTEEAELDFLNFVYIETLREHIQRREIDVAEANTIVKEDLDLEILW